MFVRTLFDDIICMIANGNSGGKYKVDDGSPAVEKFFAETKSRTAACAVRLKLKLYLPDEDGNPCEAGELVSSWTAVTTQDYQRIRESALARMQEDKPAKQQDR